MPKKHKNSTHPKLGERRGRGELFHLPGLRGPVLQTLLRNQAQQCWYIVLVTREYDGQTHKALKVHSPDYSLVPSPLMLGDNVTRAFTYMKSQCLTKHLPTKEKLTSGAAGKVWYQECLGF